MGLGGACCCFGGVDLFCFKLCGFGLFLILFV